MALSKVFSRHSFFQQVRMMLRAVTRRPGSARLAALEERLWFVSPLSLDAPVGEIGSVVNMPHQQWQVEVLTHGMTGALGALPTVYSEWMISRYYRHGDIAGKAFIDIFNNRLQALRYRAWLKYHYYALNEVSETRPLSQALRGLSGVLQSAPALQTERYAGIFAHPVRSLLNLENWLGDLFSVMVRVIPFTGGWREVGREQGCCLGSTPSLAQAPMLGTVYQDLAAGFTVQLGPVPINLVPRFLPGGKDYSLLWQRIREYVGPGLAIQIDLLAEHSSHHSNMSGMGHLGIDLCIGQPEAGYHRIRLPANQE